MEIHPGAEKWDRRFLALAEHISQWSKDKSTRTGAVIVDPLRRIVSTGYNGFPQGAADDEALYEDREYKYAHIVHADMNALLFAKRDVSGFTLYTVPMLPCADCFKHFAQAGIARCVAPVLTDPGLLERWGPSIEKVRQYAREMDITITEYPRQVVIAPTQSVYREPHLFCLACGLPLWRAAAHGPTFCVDQNCPQHLLEQEGVAL